MSKFKDLSRSQKIQILCSAITFMGGNLDMAATMIPAGQIDKDERVKVLDSAIAKLCEAAEDLGNMLNDIDFNADIDEKVTELAFEIVNEIL